jgi:hypothetical protein
MFWVPVAVVWGVGVVVGWTPKVKPKRLEGVVEVVGAVEAEEAGVGSDGVPVGEDKVEVESEIAVDSEVEAESELEVKAGPVAIAEVAMEVTMVLAASSGELSTEEVIAVPDGSAAQPVADTATVDTRVTVTMWSVPTTTVGVTIPFVAEEEMVAAVLAVLEVLDELELASADVGEEVATDDADVAMAVEMDEDVKSWRRWRLADAMGVAVTVTVTVETELLGWLLTVETPVELAVAEFIAAKVGVAAVDEVELSSSSQSSSSPSSFGSSALVEPVVLVVSFPVMPPWTPADTKRWRALAGVSHTRLSPGWFPRGRA